MAEGGTYYAWNENGETETGTKGNTLGINATQLIYQLTQPIEMPIEVFGNLQSYENGTVYVDTIVPKVGFYTSEGIVLAENDVPIKRIGSIYSVNKENGLLTPLGISKAFIFPDGKGFTHPELANGDLVSWDYVPDIESTNPAVSMKLPTNLKASVTSALQGIQELSNINNKLGFLNVVLNAHLSQNSGKHITESGENVNGRYIKFDGGTMICRGETTVSAEVAVPWGSLYYCTVGKLTFPHAFAETPYVIPLNLSEWSIILDTVGVGKTHTGNINIYRPEKTNEKRSYRVGYIAIGRWK